MSSRRNHANISRRHVRRSGHHADRLDLIGEGVERDSATISLADYCVTSYDRTGRLATSCIVRLA